ncbi:MAG: TlpA disulfide reductase family protein [Bacteroidia bacterium]|nr:TlpA disulfide reductase family protein [Bacteroidia bacterium]
MKYNHLILLAGLLLFSCTGSNNEQQNEVRIRGYIESAENREVNLSFDGAASAIGNSRDIALKVNNEGYFDTTFVLTEPAYYNLRRNTLYLTPGDNIEMNISEDNTQSTFSGIGEEANMYMKDRLFLQAGSFIESGDNIRSNFDETKKTIDSLATQRLLQLKNLSGVSDAFKKLEEARINADKINSYLSFIPYANYLKQVGETDIEIPEQAVFYNLLTSDVKPLLNEINDPEMLNVAAVRHVLSFKADSTLNELYFKDITLSERTKELLAIINEYPPSNENETPEEIEALALFAKQLKNEDFANELMYKIEQKSKLFSGKPAIDFEMEDREGNKRMLSSFKGQALYLDIWATWCAPCLKESPVFESLAKKYSGSNIAFLSISIDNEKQLWSQFLNQHQKELPQYFSKDNALIEGWSITGIPRFILIDSDFNIAYASAARPSEKEIEVQINQLLK